jgi:transglutaminase-like putative cysteine protease
LKIIMHAISTSDLLSPGRFIDSSAVSVAHFAQGVTVGLPGQTEKVLGLYRAIRDGIVYDPYVDFSDPANFRASSVLAAGRGFCVGKAALLAAAARAMGVPARVGYADVRNHLSSRRLQKKFGTNVFIWHSYADLYLRDRWVKATPAFDLVLCERLGVQALDFDGEHDSLFQAFDRDGRRHMEYLLDRGTYADVPFDAIQADFRLAYPRLMAARGLRGDFRSEATAGSE